MSVHSVNPKLRARLLAGDEPAWLKRHPRRSYIWRLALATPPWVNMADPEQFSLWPSVPRGAAHAAQA